MIKFTIMITFKIKFEIMIKFKIKFEIIFVKLKLKSKQIQETTAFSFIGHRELRQSLEDQTQETPAADAPVQQDSSRLFALNYD